MQRALTTCAVALGLTLAGGARAADAPAAGWQHAGRLGLVQYIIVAEAQARERAYYDRIINEACAERPTCFLRFFTNSKNVPVTLPLPDAIDHEATAIFQRSDKRGGADFRWSCRMKLSDGVCF